MKDQSSQRQWQWLRLAVDAASGVGSHSLFSITHTLAATLHTLTYELSGSLRQCALVSHGNLLLLLLLRLLANLPCSHLLALGHSFTHTQAGRTKCHWPHLAVLSSLPSSCRHAGHHHSTLLPSPLTALTAVTDNTPRQNTLFNLPKGCFSNNAWYQLKLTHVYNITSTLSSFKFCNTCDSQQNASLLACESVFASICNCITVLSTSWYVSFSICCKDGLYLSSC